MVIFIDESGTHKQSDHASNALVYVEVKNLETFENKMLKLLNKLDLKTFHWADHGWKVRNKFLEQVNDLSFTFKIGIFKNPVKTHEMTETVFQHLITEGKITSIYIDGKKPKWYERRLKKVLRDKRISVKKLRTVRKGSAPIGLQLADALAGLVRYYFDNPDRKDAKKWFNKFKKDKKLSSQFILT